MTYTRSISVVLIALAAAPAFLFAADKEASAKKNAPLTIATIKRSTPVDFEKDVLPALSTSCLACHNKTKAKAGLVLETPADIKKGGDDGAVVVPGKGLESLLLKASSHMAGVENPMPPPGNKVAAPDLTPEQLGLIKLWIDEGATGEVRGLQAPVTWQPMPASLDPIFAVAISNNGRFAACGRANRIDVYDLPAGKLAAHLIDSQLTSSGIDAAHRDMVESLTFSPDGTVLASGSFREIKLWRRTSAGEKLALGDKPATCIAATPDGSAIATGSEEGVIHLWDAKGKETGKLEGHKAAITGLRFSADGKKLLSGSKDKSVRVWDITDHKEFCKVEIPAEVKCVVWAEAGKVVVAGADDGMVRAWKLPAAADGAMVAGKTFKEGKSAVTALEALPTDDAHVLYASEDGGVRKASIESGTLKPIVKHGSAIAALAIRADGKRLVTAGADSSAKIWSLDDSKLVAELKGDPAVAAKSAAADRALALAKSEITYRKGRVDAAEKQAKASVERNQKAKDSVAPAEKALVDAKKAYDDAKAARDAAADTKDKKAGDTKKEESKAVADKGDTKKDDKAAKAAAEKEAAAKAAADKDAAAKAEKIANLDKELKKLEDNLKKAEGTKAAIEDEIKLSAKGSDESAALVVVAKAAAQTATDQQKLREKEAADAKKAIADSAKPIRAIAISADGALLATAGDDGVIHTWSTEKGTPSEAFEGGSVPLTSIAFAGPGRIIAGTAKAAPSTYSAASIWKLDRTIGSSESTSPFADRVTSLDFSADGKFLVSGGGVPSRSGEIRLFDAATGTLKQSFDNVHSDTVLSVRFSPDGTRLASAGTDRFVRETELSTGKVLLSLEGHTGHALSVAWSHDGHTLVSAGADNSLRFWDAETGERGKVVAGFDKEVTSVTYVGDDTQAVATSGDGKVRMVKDSGGDVRTFAGPTDFVYSVAATPDGTVIVAGGQDGVLRAWDSTNTTATASFGTPEKK